MATTIDGMSASLVYLLLRQILQMLTQLARDGGAKDVELLVLRHEVAVPPGTVSTPVRARRTRCGWWLATAMPRGAWWTWPISATTHRRSLAARRRPESAPLVGLLPAAIGASGGRSSVQPM
jgi:putative transposase